VKAPKNSILCSRAYGSETMAVGHAENIVLVAQFPHGVCGPGRFVAIVRRHEGELSPVDAVRSLAEPLNGAAIPNRISRSVMPRTVPPALALAAGKGAVGATAARGDAADAPWSVLFTVGRAGGLESATWLRSDPRFSE
jgi:hypothetical protein